jgi:hypothetical protein
MSVMTTKTVEESTARRPHYWFAALIWMGVLAASAMAVLAAA